MQKERKYVEIYQANQHTKYATKWNEKWLLNYHVGNIECRAILLLPAYCGRYFQSLFLLYKMRYFRCFKVLTRYIQRRNEKKNEITEQWTEATSNVSFWSVTKQ